MVRIAFLISLLFASSCWATEVYRSVDENGNVVFSGEPPQDKEHKVIDVEVQNDLGTTIAPASETDYYRFNDSKPQFRDSRPAYRSSQTEKVDMRTLQAKCESYRNVGLKTDQQRKKRDYWCSRLHRGK